MVTTEKLFEKYGVEVKAGSTIFEEGSPGSEMYIIHKGSVKIVRNVRDIQKTLTVLGQGDFFGEMSLLNDRPRSASALAEEDCRLLVIRRDVFETMVRDNPDIALRIMRKLAARLREADNQIEDLLIQDNPGRVVNFISRTLDDSGRKDSPTALDMTAASIAGMLGIPEAQVAVILGKLEKVEMITVSGGMLAVTDPGQLRRFSKFLEIKESFSELAASARRGKKGGEEAGRT